MGAYDTTVTTPYSNTNYNAGYFPQQQNYYNNGTPTSLGNITTQPQVPPLQNQGTAQVNTVNQQAQANLINEQAVDVAQARTERADYLKTPMGKADPYIKGASAVVGIGTSLASIYLGVQQLDLAKKAEKRADESWQEQKKELAHVRGVRKRLTSQYMA